MVALAVAAAVQELGLLVDQEHLDRATLAAWDNVEPRIGPLAAAAQVLREPAVPYLVMVATEPRLPSLGLLLHTLAGEAAEEAFQVQ